MNARQAAIQDLRRQAPRDNVVRVSFIVFVMAVLVVWVFSDFALVTVGGHGLELPSHAVRDTFNAQRLDNLQRFMGGITPRVKDGDNNVAGWAWRLFRDKGFDAMLTTLAVAVAAIVLAGAMAMPLVWLGSRNLMRAQPMVTGGREPSRVSRASWRISAGIVRSVFIVTRALPEYVLAFVLITLGPGAWPAVLALALHNFGILGRLGSEVVENADLTAAAHTRGAGGRRTQIATMVLFPQTLSRMLLYLFYRWESCVRESVILGMLGIATLGFVIQTDALPRQRYDEMVLYLLLGALLVIAGDIVSALVRRWVRNA